MPMDQRYNLEVGRWLMKYTTQAPLLDPAAANSLSIDDFGALQQAQENNDQMWSQQGQSRVSHIQVCGDEAQ